MDNNTGVISQHGDVLLNFKMDENSEAVCFQVDSAILKAKSRYFDRLLGDVRFSEAGKFKTTTLDCRLLFHDSVPQRQSSWSTVLTPRLIAVLANRPAASSQEGTTSTRPQIEIIDVGAISPVKSIRPLVADLLTLLHTGRLSSSRETSKVPLTNLANLTVVADRFDCVGAVASLIQNTNILKRPKLIKSQLDEASLRKRLLVGLLTRDNELVCAHSRDLLLVGSHLWQDNTPAPDAALWWDLPRNLEGEYSFNTYDWR